MGLLTSFFFEISILGVRNTVPQLTMFEKYNKRRGDPDLFVTSTERSAGIAYSGSWITGDSQSSSSHCIVLLPQLHRVLSSNISLKWVPLVLLVALMKMVRMML